jgi:hypothetical protein
MSAWNTVGQTHPNPNDRVPHPSRILRKGGTLTVSRPALVFTIALHNSKIVISTGDVHSLIVNIGVEKSVSPPHTPTTEAGIIKLSRLHNKGVRKVK